MTVYSDVVTKLAEAYMMNPRFILSENDVVIQLGKALSKVIDDKLEIHSELRPWIPKSNQVLRNNRWSILERLNWATKVDLAVTDPHYFGQAYEEVKKIQDGKNSLKYWRILLYPLEGFKAVFEIKVRVRNNLKRILEDIDRLNLMQEKHPDCHYSILVIDYEASSKNMNNIREYAERFDFLNFCLVNKETVIQKMD